MMFMSTLYCLVPRIILILKNKDIEAKGSSNLFDPFASRLTGCP